MVPQLRFDLCLPVITTFGMAFLRGIAMSGLSRILFLSSTFAGVYAIAVPASAQVLSDRYWFNAGAFFPDIDTSVQVSSTQDSTVGTKIDLENDLKLDDKETLPSITVGARLSDHFSINAEYYSLHRKGETILSRDIVFDDVTYPTGVDVGSSFDSDVYRLTVDWSFMRSDDMELGAAIGLHATQFEVALSGEGHVGEATLATEARRRDALAPLPTIGLYGAWAPTPRWTFTGRADYLSLTIDDYEGRLINAQATASYRLWENISVGAAYRYVDYDVKANKKRWTGDLAYTFSGPVIFIQAGF
jgi:hypothetical protein